MMYLKSRYYREKMLFIILLLCTTCTAYQVEITPQITSSLPHFWESTGLCPPQPHQQSENYLLSDDMIQNLLLISSVPHQGIKQVRIHWLLDLIKYNHHGEYDFKYLDKLVQLFYDNNLVLGFELMGSPSSRFTNFDNDTQLTEYSQLVTMIASRYVRLFGIEFVSNWRFETWNEPDHKDYDDVVMTVDGFIKYYNTSSEALNKVNKTLVFGGPAGSCRTTKFSKRCWALLQYCSNNQKCKLDYISFHKKGNADASTILTKEMETIQYIRDNYPSLSHVTVVNDEADPLVGWNRPQWWRADNTYAALVVKVITQHQNQLIANSNINYQLLSNDNAFLNYHPYYFQQRTLNARFQINNTSPNYVHFIRKPVISAMLLLAKLGEYQLFMQADTKVATIDGIASITKQQHYISTILYNSVDTQHTTGTSNVVLTYRQFDVLLLEMLMLNQLNPVSMLCHLGGNSTDPHSYWMNELGSSVFPTPAQLNNLHIYEGPHCDEPQLIDVSNLLKFSEKHFEFHVSLHLPGVVLHQLCLVEGPPLAAPIKLQAFHVTTNQVLLKWDDSSIESKCIQSYDVQYAPTNTTSFTSINEKSLLFTACYHINEQGGVGGVYRVRALDMWGKAGHFSTLLYY